MYSVKFADHVLTSESVTNSDEVYPKIWNKLFPSKVTTFVWKVVRNGIPTREKRRGCGK